MRSVSLVVAMDENRLIGRDNGLPWRLPDDMKHFKRLTLGKTVLMGRKTWDSLGKPLIDRANWIVSRDPAFRPQGEGVRAFSSLDAALAAHEDGELMVIGGAELYRQTLPLARRIYLTEVQARVDGGDAWFPAFERADFREVEAVWHPADERHVYPFRFVTLERVGG
ncbi:dihydrofolate reductase [Solimonas flava]|uniref:dihydrofolate reductase n=1 Tax=Solimonas flava TaxID=415849 RepID=UPI0003FF98DB|nr:dihydrofolate reductase [Solimonas flava]